MKKLIIPALACFIISACGNNGKDEKDSVEMSKEENRIKDSSAVNPDTLAVGHDFMVEATSSNKAEIEAGNLALQNATSAAVKQFAQMMVADHTQADSVVTAMARIKVVAIPSVPADDKMKKLDELKKKKKGADFDKAYMDLMIDEHDKAINKFEDAAKNVKDEDIRNFAAQTLPVLRKHKEEAKKTRDGLK